MEALKLLLGSDVGLLSLATILFVIVIGFWMSRFVSRKMQEKPEE
jgi:hypothetical protein